MKRIDVIRERPMVNPSIDKTTRTVRGAKRDTPSSTRKVTNVSANKPRMKLIEFEIAEAKAKTCGRTYTFCIIPIPLEIESVACINA
jgi:hypothetical protein